MKTILLLRHGKSDWSCEQEEDQQRPLAARGRKAAKRMGAFMAERGLIPDLVFTSLAVRATSTLEIVRKAGKWEAKVVETETLYGTGPAEVLALVGQAPEEVGTLLLVGHEPTFSETVTALIGGGRVRFPTGALARIDLDVSDWGAVSEGCGSLAWLVAPRLVV